MQAQPLLLSTHLVGKGVSVGLSPFLLSCIWQMPESSLPEDPDEVPHWQHRCLSRMQAGTWISGRRTISAIPCLTAGCGGLPEWTAADTLSAQRLVVLLGPISFAL